MESDSDTEIEAPDLTPDHAAALAADVPFVLPHGREVYHVTGGGPIKYGEAVQFEFEFADGSREKFHAGCGAFSRVVSDLKGFAGIAERARRATPDRPVEVVNPYQATEARTDSIGPMLVVRFPTTDGIPVLIAMEASVAEKLLIGLERELARRTGR